MNETEELKNIPEYSTWDIIRKIDKGWSKDIKYYIRNKDGQEFLLRITDNKKIGVIDFNRYDIGDPWEEFNRIVFSIYVSKAFATGQINGYFNNNVPDKFFKLMALYIASNAISSVPWAIPFGTKEVDTMLSNINEMLEYYDCFNSYKPTWYKSSYNK